MVAISWYLGVILPSLSQSKGIYLLVDSVANQFRNKDYESKFSEGAYSTEVSELRFEGGVL